MIEPDRLFTASDKYARNVICLRAWLRPPVIALLAGMAASQVAASSDPDPLHSPECEAAQAGLERALQEAAAGSTAARQGLAAARKQAMEACLGPQAGHSERWGAPPSPIAMPAPTAPPSAALGAPPAAAVAPAATPHIPRPVAITTCDAGGCWDSEGRRLNFMGPVLISPQGGVCTLQAGAVLCPQ